MDASSILTGQPHCKSDMPGYTLPLLPSAARSRRQLPLEVGILVNIPPNTWQDRKSVV